MHRTLRPTVALALVAACGAPAQRPAPAAPRRQTGVARVDSASLLHDLSVLDDDSMQGRLAGTPGGERARAYVVRRFREIGLQPLFDSLVEPVDVTAEQRKRVGPGEVANVVGVVRGTRTPERYIVLSAHYDHVGIGKPVNGDSIYNGADDNASGTAAILAVARDLVRSRPATSVIVAAVDAEERGELGSKALVKALAGRDVVLDVNLDMVSHNAKGELYAAGASHWPLLRAYVDSVAAAAPVRLLQGHDRPLPTAGDDWTAQSDHKSFHDVGIPWVYLGVEDHPDYHRPSDEVRTITPSFFVGAAETALELVRFVDRHAADFAAAKAAAH